jgi:hypothetical protein
LPSPTADPENLRAAVEALRSAVQELMRQRGDMMDSALTVRDLVSLGLVEPERVRTLERGGATYRAREVPGANQDPTTGTGSVSTIPIGVYGNIGVRAPNAFGGVSGFTTEFTAEFA